jgi:hypothetical protein
MRGKAAHSVARHRLRSATAWRLLRGNEGAKRALQRPLLPPQAMRAQHRRQLSRYSASASRIRARRWGATRCCSKPVLRRGTSMGAPTRRARLDLPTAPRRVRAQACGCQSQRGMQYCSGHWASMRRCARPRRRTSTSTPISSRTMPRRLGRTKRSCSATQRRLRAACRQCLVCKALERPALELLARCLTFPRRSGLRRKSKTRKEWRGDQAARAVLRQSPPALTSRSVQLWCRCHRRRHSRASRRTCCGCSRRRPPTLRPQHAHVRLQWVARHRLSIAFSSVRQ